MKPPSIARTAALVALGALAVHQLRYLLSFGGGAGHELAAQGHAYLAPLIPLLVAVSLAIACAGLIRAARGRLTAAGQSGVPARAVGFFAAIICAYSAQELAEGVLFAGHPAGVEALVGSAGWVALPLAAAFGLLAAGVEWLLDRLERRVSPQPAGRVLPRSPRSATLTGRTAFAPPSASPLAFGLARRPPPLPG